MKILQPVIKWSGGKRSQAEQIISYFPKQIDTYKERLEQHEYNNII